MCALTPNRQNVFYDGGRKGGEGSEMWRTDTFRSTAIRSVSVDLSWPKMGAFVYMCEYMNAVCVCLCECVLVCVCMYECMNVCV